MKKALAKLWEWSGACDGAIALIVGILLFCAWLTITRYPL